VQRLMRLMGIVALVPRPGTSKPAPGHKISPYLLRGVAITLPSPAGPSCVYQEKRIERKRLRYIEKAQD
jgi:hypothetical protein